MSIAQARPVARSIGQPITVPGDGGGEGVFSPSSLGPMAWFLDGGSAYHSTEINSVPHLRSRESFGTYRAPRKGRAVKGNGSDIYASGAIPSGTFTSGTLFIRLIALSGSTFANSRLIEIGTAADHVGMYISAAGALIAAGRKSSALQFTISGSSVKDSSLHTAALTFEDNSVKLFLDGSEVGTEDTSSEISISSGTVELFRDVSAGNYYSDYLLDARFYDAVKTPAQVLAIHNESGGTPDHADIQGHWWLNEEGGTEHFDCSGGGNSLTINNAILSSYHVDRSEVTFNPANKIGFTDDSGVIVPRDESTPTDDADSGTLGNTGQCPYPAEVNVPCITGDGSAVYADLGSDMRALLSIAADFTVRFFFQYTGSGGQLLSATNSGTDRFVIAVTSGHLRCTAYDGSNSSKSGAVTAGQWYLAEVSYDSSADTVSLTLDGVAQAGGLAQGTSAVTGCNLLANSSGSGFFNGRVAGLEITRGGTTTYLPLQESAGRDLWWVDSAGSSNKLTSAIKNGTLVDIWANTTNRAKDHGILFGGTQSSGVFIPGKADGSGDDADGNTNNRTAGRLCNAASNLDANPFSAAEYNGRGIPSAHEIGDAWASAISPANSAFVRQKTAGDDRFIIFEDAQTGSDLSNMNTYVS